MITVHASLLTTGLSCIHIQYADTRPTLTELLKFLSKSGITNILWMIGTNYHIFGTLLLNDICGEKIKTITEEAGARGTNFTILMKWLHGEGEQLATWRTLIQVLKDSELRNLAHKIEGLIYDYCI